MRLYTTRRCLRQLSAESLAGTLRAGRFWSPRDEPGNTPGFFGISRCEIDNPGYCVQLWHQAWRGQIDK